MKVRLQREAKSTHHYPKMFKREKEGDKMDTEKEVLPPPPKPKPSTPVKETKKEQKTLTSDDFAAGFEASMRGAGAFLNTQFKDDFTKVLQKQDVKIKDWGPIGACFQAYNVALGQLYLTKTLEILSLPTGTKLSVESSEEEEKARRKSPAKIKLGK
jgi:hypothetical protein